MVRAFLFISFLITISSLSWAQDTIVLRSGQKIAVKVIYVIDKVQFSIPPDDRPISMKLSNISYIKYGDGTLYNVRKNRDSTKEFKFKPYILLSGGIDFPLGGGGYGTHFYQIQYEEIRGYSGYADNGSESSLTFGINFYKGLEFTAMFSYIRNQFDASGVLAESTYPFSYANNYIYIQNANSDGNYFYNNYLFMGGITDSWGKKNVHIGIGLLVGDMITYVPAMHGIVYGDNSANNISPVSYYCSLNSIMPSGFIADLTAHIDVDFKNHIFLRGMMEMELGGINYPSQNIQYNDITTGNTVYSGNAFGGSDLFVALFNINLGVGYKF